jgi:membrane associated rhomboid family serine protease
MVEFADIVLINVFGVYIDNFGVLPRSQRGLIGIIIAPFLHANFAHLAANCVSLFILGLAGCAYSRRLTFVACVYSSLFAGVLTWVIGKEGAPHVGASGVIFGLIGFLLANGIVRGGLGPLFLSIAVFLFYGGIILSNILPGNAAAHISWEMHLGGFLGGLYASWKLRKKLA